MYKRIVQKIRDMKVRDKIISIYFIFGLIPLLSLGIFAFSRINRLLIVQEMSSDRSMIQLTGNTLDADINIYNNLSDYLSYSETVANVLGYDYASSYDFYKEITTTLDPMMNSVQFFQSNIRQLTIYSNDIQVSHGTTLIPLNKIKEKSWYKKAISSNTPVWIIDKERKEVFSVRRMPVLEKKGKMALLYIEVDYDKLFTNFENLKEKNYSLFIAKDNNVLYEKHSKDKLNNSMLSFSDILALKKEKDDRLISNNSKKTGWTIYYYHGADALTDKAVKINMFVALFVALAGIIATWIALYLSSKFIVGRIDALMTNVKNVEKGQLEVTVESNDKDEIGTLIRGFGAMIRRIKYLIEQVYESKLLQKNYEMRALQQQINPHFLYNTLSMINFMAIETGQNDISRITLSLSDFYRTSLNKGRNTCSLADEIKNMNAYLDIQMMMHDYDFDLDIQIEDEIMECETPNLILQPIVENAIGHGIDLLEDRKGIIKVYATTTENHVYIMVEDNGVGMDEATIDKMLAKNSKGYGMRNVNERIKLIYGPEYHLHIESVVGQGTVITIKLPKKIYQKPKEN